MDFQKSYINLKNKIIRSIKDTINPHIKTLGGEIILTDSIMINMECGYVYVLKIMEDGFLTTDYEKVEYQSLNLEALLEFHSFIQKGIII